MKVYSVGREQNCDIVIEDNTDFISRRHLLINVYPSGKMTIIDQSQNGTFVNGIRISPRVPVPVTRKDNVSLAHVVQLDWSRVPKPVPVMRFVIIGIAALVVIAAAVFGYIYLSGKSDSNGDYNDEGLFSILNEEPADSLHDEHEGEPAEAGDEQKEEASEKGSSQKSASQQQASQQQGSSQQSAEQQPASQQQPAEQTGGGEAGASSKGSATGSEPAAAGSGGSGEDNGEAEKTDTVKRATRIGFN